MQNVNLYVPELRPKKEWLTARVLVSLSVGLLVMLVVASVVSHFQLEQYEQSIVHLESQRVAARKRVDDIKSRSSRGDVVKLEAQAQVLRQTINSRLLVNDLIVGQSLGNELGYSERLRIFAKNVPDALSLSHFRFSGGDAFVEISGQSRTPSVIADFVGILKSDPSFQSANFGNLTLSDHEKSQGVYDFSFGFEPLFLVDGALTGTN